MCNLFKNNGKRALRKINRHDHIVIGPKFLTGPDHQSKETLATSRLGLADNAGTTAELSIITGTFQ
jgi:hypothetical protein